MKAALRMPGTLFVVATPIGNLEDITARALRIMREVALIAAEDTRRTAKLLAHYGISTPTTSLHEHNEQQKIGRLIERLGRGENVAVVSDAGTPVVSDPGSRLVRAAIDAGIRVEPIPGPSAVTLAIAGAGFPLDDGFTFLGFPPTRGEDRTTWLDRAGRCDGVLVFFEAPHRIIETLGDLGRTVGMDAEVVVGRELTKIHEEWVRGPIAKVMRRIANPIGEFTVVIDIGHKPNLRSRDDSTTIDWTHELGELTKNAGVSKRRAINVLAKRTGMAPNEVYAAIERSKKSGT